MKPILKQFLAIMLLAMVLPMSAYAQRNGGEDGWRERMRSQKIAFITAEVGLTPQEAEKFWPVYNQIEREQHETIMEIGRSYVALEKAVTSGASDKEIEQRLMDYSKAQSRQRDLEGVQVARYEKILSKVKIAKLYLAEEKFRRQQINRLHPPQPAPPQAQR